MPICGSREAFISWDIQTKLNTKLPPQEQNQDRRYTLESHPMVPRHQSEKGSGPVAYRSVIYSSSYVNEKIIAVGLMLLSHLCVLNNLLTNFGTSWACVDFLSQERR